MPVGAGCVIKDANICCTNYTILLPRGSKACLNLGGVIANVVLGGVAFTERGFHNSSPSHSLTRKGSYLYPKLINDESIFLC